MFTCKTCSGRSFTDAQALQMHKQSKHPIHHKCKTCDRHFLSVDALEQHNSAKHLHHCKRCSRQFVSLQALEQHNDTKHPVFYACKKCSRQFASSQALEQHMAANHAPTFNCYICGRDFKSEEALQSHRTTKHPSTTHTRNRTLQSSESSENQVLQASIEYQCSSCGLTLQSLDALELHRLYGHLSKHECPICNQEFYSLEALDLHRNAGHLQTRDTCMQKHESTDDLTQRTLAIHVCNCKICHRELQALQLPGRDAGTSHSEKYEHSVSSDRDAATPISLKRHLENEDSEAGDINIPKRLDEPGQDASDHSPLMSCYDSFDEETHLRDEIEEHGVTPSSPKTHCSDWGEHVIPRSPLPTCQPLRVKDQYLGPALPEFGGSFYRCYFTDMGYYTVQELQEHMNIHPACTKCELLFLDISWYSVHCAEMHSDCYCPSCHWQFDTAEALEHHYRHFASHPKCEGCDVGFVDEETYLLHVSNHGSRLPIEHVSREPRVTEQVVAFAGEYCENEEAIAAKLESVSGDHHDYNSEYATDEDADHLSHSEHLHASVSSHDLDSAMLQRLDRRLESSRTSLGESESFISPRDTSPLLCVAETHSPMLSRSESPVHFPHDNPDIFRFEARSPRTISPSLESSGMLPLGDGTLGANLALHSHSATINDVESQHTSFLKESDDREYGGLGLQDDVLNYEVDHRTRARPSSVASSGRLSDDFEGLSSPETSIILISKESLPKHIQSGQAYLVATSAKSTGSQSPISSDPGSPLFSSTLSPSYSSMSFYGRQGQHLEMLSSPVSRRTGQGNHIDVKQGSELSGKADKNEPSTTSRHAFDGHALRFHCRLCQVNPCEDMTVTMCGHIFCNKCITREVIATSACPVCKAATLLYCLFRLDLTS